jgi:hypothetical protein
VRLEQTWRGKPLSDDNVIKFRKPPPPQKPKRPLRVPAWAIVILGALVIGGVSYVLDQQKAAAPSPGVAAP